MAATKFLRNSVNQMEVLYAMPEECDHSLLVSNLVQFPEASKRYSQLGASLGNEKA